MNYELLFTLQPPVLRFASMHNSSWNGCLHVDIGCFLSTPPSLMSRSLLKFSSRYTSISSMTLIPHRLACARALCMWWKYIASVRCYFGVRRCCVHSFNTWNASHYASHRHTKASLSVNYDWLAKALKEDSDLFSWHYDFDTLWDDLWSLKCDTVRTGLIGIEVEYRARARPEYTEKLRNCVTRQTHGKY